MTLPEILSQLEPYTGRFPMKAMRGAVNQREAITPELLKVLETCAEDPVAFAKREDYMLHVFGYFQRLFGGRQQRPLGGEGLEQFVAARQGSGGAEMDANVVRELRQFVNGLVVLSVIDLP